MKRHTFNQASVRTIISSFFCILSPLLLAQTTGKIILEHSVPSTAVVVTATQQVVLRPGFHAKGDASSSFDARIGTSNSLSPVIQVASGSTITIPTTPSSSQNYILTKTYLLPSDDSPTLNTVQYFDGLGRPTQTVAAGITPSGADLVSQVGYDAAGRQNKTYLPVAVGGNFGLYTDDSSISSATSTLYGSDSRPFAETLLEASPLNRVTGQKKPGAEWDGHPASVSYDANGSDILYFTVSGNTLAKGTNYATNTLYKTTTTDEDGKVAVEYKDKLGHVVVKKAGSASDNTQTFTYYVYNDLDQLAYVLPPAFIDGVGSTTSFDDTNVLLKQYAYIYRYDERGNCIYKKLPACTPIYMVYDKADRMVLSQDGNQRNNRIHGNAQWTTTQYDTFGRVISTGLMYRSESDSSANYQTIRDIYANIVVNDSYTGFSSNTPLTVNYYDNYSFLADGSNLTYDNSQEQNGYTAQYSNATGLLTGTRVYYLDGSGNSNVTAMYYDDDAKVVQSRSTNHLGGYDLTYNQYDFTGKVLKTLKKHKIATSNEVSELYTYSYDNGQRLTTTAYSLNGGSAVTLASNEYDELGRLKTKTRHNGKEAGAYEYNIQNWPTKIKQGEFIENLYYTSGIPQGGCANYNGNIAATTWTYNTKQGSYAYLYDNLNRLTSAFSQYDGTDYNCNVEAYGGCNESYTYDKMGNITILQREGINGDDIDYLNYTYSGNQVTSISDDAGSLNQYNVKEYQDKAHTSNEMTYDVNGNMVKDLDRDIVTIQYNVLNLPSIIQFKNGNQIQNLYDASGKKLQANYYTRLSTLPVPLADGEVATDVSSTNLYLLNGNDYVGNFEYVFSNDLGDYQHDLDKIYNDEGYVQGLANPLYYYFRHDHLGDNREVWLANTNTVVQRTQYYPSGLPWVYQRGDNPDLQHRKYNGKEFIEMHGYDTYDIVWRQYYPATMRFQTQDPFAEKYYNLSPYTMCADNMVRYTDPDGRFIPIIIAAIVEAPELYLLGAAVVLSVTNSIHHYQSQHNTSSYRSNYNESTTTQKATQNAKKNVPPPPNSARRERKQQKHAEKSHSAAAQKKAHSESVNNNIGTPSSDGSPDPKRPIDKTSTATAIAVGVSVIVTVEYDNNPNKQLKDNPITPQPKVENKNQPIIENKK